jgi:hypothetical protein
LEPRREALIGHVPVLPTTEAARTADLCLLPITEMGLAEGLHFDHCVQSAVRKPLGTERLLESALYPFLKIPVRI